MQSYNSNLRKLKSLYQGLFTLTKWGLLFNSYTVWKFLVNKHIGLLNLYIVH